jgi:hypothetical protein
MIGSSWSLRFTLPAYRLDFAESIVALPVYLRGKIMTQNLDGVSGFRARWRVVLLSFTCRNCGCFTRRHETRQGGFMANKFGTDILIQAPDPQKAARFYVEKLGLNA